MFTAPAKDFRETNSTVLPASHRERQLGFRRTLRKGKRVSRPTNSIISWREPEDAGRGGNPADDCTEPDLFFSRTREGSHGQSGRVAEDTKRSDRRHSASGLAESKEPGSGNWYYRPRTCIPFSSAFFSVSRQRRPM